MATTLLSLHTINFFGFDFSTPGGIASNPALSMPKVLSFVGRDSASECYEYKVDILLELAPNLVANQSIDPSPSYSEFSNYLLDSFVRFSFSTLLDATKNSQIVIGSGGKIGDPTKTIFAYVSEFQELSRVVRSDWTGNRRVVLRLTLRPLLYFADRTENTRVFRNQSPREMLAYVLSQLSIKTTDDAIGKRSLTYIANPSNPTSSASNAGQLPLAFINYENAGSTPNVNPFGYDSVFNQKIAFYMQYKETDLSFIQRLLDMSGCFFYISYTGQANQMIETVNIVSYDFNIPSKGDNFMMAARMPTDTKIVSKININVANVAIRQHSHRRVDQIEVIDYPTHGN